MLATLIFYVMILITLVACQQNIPSPTVLSSPSPAAQLDSRATHLPRDIAPRLITGTPTAPSVDVYSASLIFPPSPTSFVYVEPTLAPDALIVGRSVEGRSIVARKLGTGEKLLLLVGGMHGGWEANTVTLINQLITHFDEHPDTIPPGLALAFIPAANPDGLVRGLAPEGRFNGNGVDLNRNWGCNWTEQAYWRNQTVSAGTAPFSEPETRALAEYIQREEPATVLFYHSAAAGVYAGSCGGDAGSALMSQLYGQAAGYTYGQAFSAYPVTGTAATWVNSLGIPSADVELQTQTDSEFARNMAGVLAVMTWLSSGS